MKTSEFIASMRATPGEVALTTDQVLARHQAAAGREEPVVSLEDAAEENALRMLQSGYQPGAISALAQQLGDALAALEEEKAKLEAGRRRSDQVSRMHAQGKITAWQVPEMLGDSGGDEGKVERLERRIAGLRQALADASEASSATAERARLENMDPLERATRQAHQTFRETTRAMRADMEAGRAPRPGPRPFVSRSGGAVPAETCADCERVGATGAESVKIHEGLDAARGETGYAEISR